MEVILSAITEELIDLIMYGTIKGIERVVSWFGKE
jgi:hypothetical protein